MKPLFLFSSIVCGIGGSAAMVLGAPIWLDIAAIVCGLYSMHEYASC
jgi:hypothetical protein